MHLESRVKHGITTVDMMNPPVNCLSLDIRRELYQTFTVSALDPHISAIVLNGSGKYFCAGGDLREMGTEAASAEPRLSADLLPAIERCPRAVIAAMHGAVIGGVFELACCVTACSRHCRATDSATPAQGPIVTHLRFWPETPRR